VIDTRGAGPDVARVARALTRRRDRERAGEQMAIQTESARRAATRAQGAIRTVAGRARGRWQRRDAAAAPEQPWKQRVEGLEARLRHVEAELEGLQDAVHRQAVHQHEDTEDLRRRLAPEEMARALSDDARRRGL
jgi:hypothetical protein